MAKTKEELNALKEEVEAMSRKLHELTDEELAQVIGGGCYFRSGNNDDEQKSTSSKLGSLR